MIDKRYAEAGDIITVDLERKAVYITTPEGETLKVKKPKFGFTLLETVENHRALDFDILAARTPPGLQGVSFVMGTISEAARHSMKPTHVRE